MGVRINKISKVLGTFTGGSSDPLLTSNAATGKVDTSTNSFGSLPNGTIWIGDATNTPVPRFISGDITISNGGVAAIGTGVIVNADINAAAAIALTKLAPLGFSFALVSNGAGFITTSLTTDIQIGYLSTTTSDVQVQLNAKQGIITGAASSVVTTNLNPNIIPATDGSGKFISSTTTVTALSYVNTLTSPAQAQIDTKLTANPGSAALGDLLYYNGSNWTRFPIGTAGQILTTTGSTIGWGSATANGLPVGGSAAQFLAKNSGINYDASWFTLSVSLITDILATAAQINASTTYLTTGGVPTGTNGQALTIIGGIMGWSNVGTGTVTSVGVTGGTTGLTFSGSPVTTSGTMVMAGTLATVNGGTNQTAVAIGDLLYGSGVNTWSRLPASTNGFVLTLAAGVPTWAATGAGSFWVVNGATALTANTSQTGNFTNTFSLNSVVVNQNNQTGAGVPSAFVINGGTHTSVTTVVGLRVTASTGATNNYAATFLGGNVGIGTSVPDHRLHVSENSAIGTGIRIENLGTGSPELFLTRTGGTASTWSTYLPSGTGDYRINGGGTDKLTILANGNVGIGTTAPTDNLTVSTGGNTVIGINSGVSNGAFLYFKNNNVPFWGLVSDPSGRFDIYDNASNKRVSILQNGNVGIGTTNPQAKLEIGGNAYIGNRTNGLAGDYQALWVFNTVAANQSSGNGAVIQFFNGTNNDLGNTIVGASIKSVSADGQFGWQSDLYLRTAHNNSFTTQTIYDAIQIRGANGQSIFKALVNGTNIGVYTDGTIVNGFHYFFSGTYAASGVDYMRIGMHSTGTNNPDYSFINVAANVPLTFWTNDTERMRITAAGLVGIGTTGPVELLHLSSPTAGANGTSIRIDNTSATGRNWRIRSNAAGELDFLDMTGAATRVAFRTDGGVQFLTLTGTGTTTAQINSNGILMRATALTFDGTDNLIIEDGKSIFTGLVTGTMIGTSDLQKIGFFGQTPDRQPDTGLVSIPKLTFGGSPIGENDTIGGYTIGQVVAALKQLGLLQ